MPTDSSISAKKNKRNLWATRFILLLIIAFGFFLRYEDFSTWNKHKASFQFMNEYQMANYDSYYYLKAAKDLTQGQYGHQSELRRVPNGVTNPVLPPLSSLLVSTLHKLTGIPIATLAIFMPVVFASLLAFLIFVLARQFEYNRITALVAALFSILSISYIVRTRVGVFDTDSLNVIFPLLIAYLFFMFAIVQGKSRFKYLAYGLLNALLFYMWWHTAGSIVVVAGLFPFLVAFIFFFKTDNTLLKYAVLGLVSVLSLYLVGDQLLSYFNLLVHKTQSGFPNNMSVSELNTVNLNYFIKNTAGNMLLFTLMMLGLLALGWKLKLKALFFAVPVALSFLAFIMGNRFMIFAAPVLALGLGYILQLLHERKLHPIISYVVTGFIVIIGLTSNYNTITKGYKKTAALDNVQLLTILDKNTPKQANIWTDWDLGYQIQYYLDRGTYADGEYSDGEFYYYVAFPMAVDDPMISANFIRFYNKHGKSGMDKLYKIYSDIPTTFAFLKKIFSVSPSSAEKILEMDANTAKFGSTKEFVSFLFPKESEDVYFFIYYKMTQTAAWFKQGNANLVTGKTEGLPLFLALNNLKRQGKMIKSNEFLLNTENGVGNYMGKSKQAFQSILTYDGTQSTEKKYGLSHASDTRFVFQWNEKTGFGAAMSKEMANTTFVKLFMQEIDTKDFEAVVLNNPHYQLWKITGNAYD